MKKGFTLVELLAVFTIMAAIVLVSVPAVTNMLKKIDEEQCTNFKNDLFLAAEAYLSTNNDSYPEIRSEGMITYVSVKSLLYSDYLDSTSVNPCNKNKPEEQKKLYNETEYSKIILVKIENKIWKYEFIENLNDSEKNIVLKLDALTKNSSTTEKDELNTLINNLSTTNTNLKVAFQNRYNAIINS